jgi:hypothetical protein
MGRYFSNTETMGRSLFLVMSGYRISAGGERGRDWAGRGVALGWGWLGSGSDCRNGEAMTWAGLGSRQGKALRGTGLSRWSGRIWSEAACRRVGMAGRGAACRFPRRDDPGGTRTVGADRAGEGQRRGDTSGWDVAARLGSAGPVGAGRRDRALAWLVGLARPVVEREVGSGQSGAVLGRRAGRYDRVRVVGSGCFGRGLGSGGRAGVEVRMAGGWAGKSSRDGWKWVGKSGAGGEAQGSAWRGEGCRRDGWGRDGAARVRHVGLGASWFGLKWSVGGAWAGAELACRRAEGGGATGVGGRLGLAWHG